MLKVLIYSQNHFYSRHSRCSRCGLTLSRENWALISALDLFFAYKLLSKTTGIIRPIAGAFYQGWIVSLPPRRDCSGNTFSIVFSSVKSTAAREIFTECTLAACLSLQIWILLKQKTAGLKSADRLPLQTWPQRQSRAPSSLACRFIYFGRTEIVHV